MEQVNLRRFALILAAAISYTIMIIVTGCAMTYLIVEPTDLTSKLPSLITAIGASPILVEGDGISGGIILGLGWMGCIGLMMKALETPATQALNNSICYTSDVETCRQTKQ